MIFCNVRLTILFALGFAWFVMTIPTHADVTDLVRLRMGENIKGQPTQIVSTVNGLTLEAVGEPQVVDDVSPRAKRMTGSTRSMAFKSGDGFKVSGLPATPKNNIGVELWVKPATQDGFRNLVNYGGKTGLGPALQKNGTWGVVYGKATVGWQVVAPGEWVHLAIVIDNGEGRFFVNGREAGRADDAVSWGYKRDAPMSIGLPVAKGNEPFEGLIDEVRVFTFESGTFEPKDLLYYEQQTAAAVPPAAVAEIVFDKQPVEKGLTFDRSTMRYAPVEGKQAWAGIRSAVPGMGWIKDINLTMTDERFRDGQMPVVDVEAVVRLDTWAGITAYADTERGSARASMKWGASPKWKRMKFQLDDAYFGSRDHGTTGRQLQSDGYDLRFFGANEPLYIHSIKVTGYQRTGEVDWQRLLRAKRPVGIATHGDSGLLVFKQDNQAQINLPIRNLALDDTTVRYQFRVIDDQGNTMVDLQEDVNVPGESNEMFSLGFDTAGWPLGSYQYTYRLEHPSSDLLIQEIQGHLGLYEPGDIPKASDGEFLFGLQHTGDPLMPRNAAWIDLLGVDILRGGLRTHTHADSSRSATDETYAALRAKGMRVMPMIDPPKPGSPVQYDEDGMDPDQRARELAKKTAFLETFARDYADWITHYELGNEPDLPFFYPGPVEEYVDSFIQMRQAIKRGNPDAIVMTGGLCFHTDIGDRRARRIIELLAPDGVDAWSYHSHGPGYAAQRKNWERLYEATKKHDAHQLVFIDTETGMAAHGEAQLKEQARTVVEKFVYTMSKGAPMTFFFALHFKDGTGAYTMVEHNLEPRPVTLAYRNLVKTLRGSRFVATVDNISDSLRAYRFTNDATGRQTVVAWSQEDRTTPLRLALRHDANQAVEAIDLFGNRHAIEPIGGVVNLSIGPDPIFLTWVDPKAVSPSHDDVDGLVALPPLLMVDGPVIASPGKAAQVDLVIRQPSGTQSFKQLKLAERLFIDNKLDHETTIDLNVSSETQAMRSVAVQVPASYDLPAWPTAWRVFAKHREAGQNWKVDPGKHLTIPARLAGVEGQWVLMDGPIDLAAIAGGFRERDAAVAMTSVWSPRDMTVRMGAAADWWMQWWVNGQPVYDTMRRGNDAGVTPTAHTFDVQFKQGWNTLTVKVLSGSAGWRLIAAGPSQLESMLHPDAPPNRIELKLTDASGHWLETLVAPLKPRPLVTAVTERKMLDDYHALPPLAILGQAYVTNFHEAHPDTSRWYGGEEDLSATIWVLRYDNQLSVGLRITDDQPRANQDQAIVKLSFDDGTTMQLKLSRTTTFGRDFTGYAGTADIPMDAATVTIGLEIKDIDTDELKQTLTYTTTAGL